MSDETKGQKLSIGHRLFFLACALLIGFAAGRSVGEAAGAITPISSSKPLTEMEGSESALVVVSMILLAFFVFAAFRFLLLLGERVVTILGQVQARPNVWVALAIIVCGTLCLLSAVALQWHAATMSALPAVSVPGTPDGPITGGLSIRARTSWMVPVTTIGVLIAGAAIVGVGIWGSVPPRQLTSLAHAAPREVGEGSPSMNPPTSSPL